ncbi:MAG TPA: 3-dehydroquinate synthase [Pyrinomonadaceae bacterium]|jgi:3-dehydroquinate synthase|nr:3-dehydroquinate synthase [Pyrinomonadaceae bacterium]
MMRDGDRGRHAERGLQRVRVRVGAGHEYEIAVGRDVLDTVGETARRALSPHARRVVVISNARVFKLYGARTVASLDGAGFRVAHWLMGDGERYKTLRTAERALAFFAAGGLERTDAVVALGGGVVGDLAGFAASLYLRGIAYIHLPTTLLAQIDSSVGGKTAVNLRAGKNLVGAFHQPRAVVADIETLQTLAPRELTAGWCEAIKQGAVGDRALFEQTRRFLVRWNAGRKLPRARARIERGEDTFSVEDALPVETAQLVAAHCEFKAGIVAGDEREDVSRTDARSRRILNFGHTVGHALEAVTHYRRFRHGEAVGYGMLAAAEISRRLGLLDESELESLRETIRLAGRLPRALDLDVGSIIRTLAGDKKAVGGHVRWVLLERLGSARILSAQEIAPRTLRASIHAALRF